MVEVTLDALRSGKYDFVDFGCSNGGSLKFGLERLGGKRGLGIDISETKVASTISSGYEAIQLDATQLGEYGDCVSFSLMFHFLEHLDGYRTAQQCIRSACMASRDYVFIRFPWFDSDGYLFLKGLKLYWSDWTGHTYHMTCVDLHRALRDCNLPMRYRIYGNKPIASFADEALHALRSPCDQHARTGDLQRELSGGLRIEVPTFYETGCIILLSERYTFQHLEKAMGKQTALHEEKIA